MVVAALAVLLVARAFGLRGTGMTMISASSTSPFAKGHSPCKNVSFEVATGEYGVLMGQHGQRQDDAPGGRSAACGRSPPAASA